MKKDKKGFTLIELLVVIAIIAILSTVVMAGLNSARQKGRDAKRLSDVKQVQAALELFYDSNNGYFSIAEGTLSTQLNSTPFTAYMNPLPVNPTPSHASAANYLYSGSPTTYTIKFALEGTTGSLTTAGLYAATPSGIQKI